jgi:hypothetical protein
MHIRYCLRGVLRDMIEKMEWSMAHMKGQKDDAMRVPGALPPEGPWGTYVASGLLMSCRCSTLEKAFLKLLLLLLLLAPQKPVAAADWEAAPCAAAAAAAPGGDGLTAPMRETCAAAAACAAPDVLSLLPAAFVELLDSLASLGPKPKSERICSCCLCCLAITEEGPWLLLLLQLLCRLAATAAAAAAGRGVMDVPT